MGGSFRLQIRGSFVGWAGGLGLSGLFLAKNKVVFVVIQVCGPCGAVTGTDENCLYTLNLRGQAKGLPHLPGGQVVNSMGIPRGHFS
jgi:hypothetical protein